MQKNSLDAAAQAVNRTFGAELRGNELTVDTAVLYPCNGLVRIKISKTHESGFIVTDESGAFYSMQKLGHDITDQEVPWQRFLDKQKKKYSFDYNDVSGNIYTRATSIDEMLMSIVSVANVSAALAEYSISHINTKRRAELTDAVFTMVNKYYHSNNIYRQAEVTGNTGKSYKIDIALEDRFYVDIITNFKASDTVGSTFARHFDIGENSQYKNKTFVVFDKNTPPDSHSRSLLSRVTHLQPVTAFEQRVKQSAAA